MNPLQIDPSTFVAKISGFFAHKQSVYNFLAITFVVALALVVFGNEEVLLSHTTQQSPLQPTSQVAIAAVVAFAVLVGSRWLLCILLRRTVFSLTGLLVWVLGEVIVIVAATALMLWWLSGAGPVQLAPLAGMILAITTGVLLMPYVVSVLLFRLGEEHAEVMRLRGLLAEGDAQSFLSSNMPKERTLQFKDRGNRLIFSTAVSNILYVEAADNYVNIHYLNEGREDTFILHNTMKQLESDLADTPLLRCHRCYFVNSENVKLLRKEGVNLVLELRGSFKVIPVTKTYAAQVTARLAASVE